MIAAVPKADGNFHSTLVSSLVLGQNDVLQSQFEVFEASILIDLDTLDLIVDLNCMKICQGRNEDRYLLEIHLHMCERSLSILLGKLSLDFMVKSVDLLCIVPHALREEDKVLSFSKAGFKIGIDILCFKSRCLTRSF